MSYISKTYGTDKGATHSATKLKVEIPQFKYAEDFAVTENTAKSVVLTNAAVDVDDQETIRFAIQDISNIYAGSSIDPVMYAPSKKGKSVVVSINDTLTVKNIKGTQETPGDTESEYKYPVSAHFVVKFPSTANLEAADLVTLINRMFGLAYDSVNSTGGAPSTPNARVNELMRGVLNPIQ